MNDQELQRLMNDRLDGVLTPEESERLTRFLQSSEKAQGEYQKLGQVFSALRQAPLEEPPANLKQNVLREIRLRTAAAPAREGWLGTIVSAFRVRPALRYAYSFAAGAALGVLAFAVISGNMMNRPGIDLSPVTGTMMAPSEGVTYQRIASRDFKLREGHISAETLLAKDQLLARLTLEAPPGTDVILEFDPAAWGAIAVRQATAGNEVMLGSGRLSIRMQRLGQSQYLLYLARRGPAGSPLRILIHSPDETVHGGLMTELPGPAARR
jgi:hypothetical protein